MNTLLLGMGLAFIALLFIRLGRGLSRKRELCESACARREEYSRYDNTLDSLGVLGLRERYDINRAHYLQGLQSCNHERREDSFYNFIATSFVWENTPEGVDFWYTIALKKV